MLYTGDTTITVISGQNVSYSVELNYVGPEVGGTIAMRVILGSIGTVTLNGQLENYGIALNIPSGMALIP